MSISILVSYLDNIFADTFPTAILLLISLILQHLEDHGLKKKIPFGKNTQSILQKQSSLCKIPLDKGVHSFICNALDAVNEEVEKLDEGETLPGTTEIVESLFGSHKNHSACGGHGITANVLTLGALVGKTLTQVRQLPSAVNFHN